MSSGREQVLLPSGTLGSRKRIGLLCLSAIPDDPRVRRQGDVLKEAGWDVVGFGLPEHRSPAPSWTSLAIAGRARGEASKFVRRVRAAYRIARVNLQPAYSNRAYWRTNLQFAAIYELARSHRVDLWLANDWTTIPISARLASEQGVPYAYDTHEFAADEYAQSLKWRILQRKLTIRVEGTAIGGAAFVTCVSDGIADRLTEIYRLSNRPIVIRNTPSYEAHTIRRTGEIITVLYHGVVSPGRGLEASIESVALWRPAFRLVIRGPASDSYRRELQEIARRAGVADRVAFHPPVPMTELVAQAASADVGLFALPDHSLQNAYVLPNKFFEYTMAGLALCVSALPEMTRLLRAHDLGVLIETLTPAAIAEAINSLDCARIDRYKANALAAAKMLNWQAEGRKLVELCDAALVNSRQVYGNGEQRRAPS